MLTVNYVADGASSTYGDALPSLSGTYGVSGLVNGDTQAAIATGTASWISTAGATSNAGSYAVTGSGISSASSNYSVVAQQAAGNATALSITPRALTVTANAQSMIYGNAVPSLTYVVGGRGLVNGDTLLGTLATTASSAANVGSYGITQGTLSGGGNYTISFTGGTLSITPAALMVSYTANAVSSAYGNSPSGLTGTVVATGLVNGDTMAVVTTGTMSWITAATAASNVGAYAVMGAGLSANSSNYSFTFNQAGTNTRALTIAPRQLTITVSDLARTYGDANPALTYAITGGNLVNGDALSGAPSTNATAASGAGRYVIGQGSLAASANYSLTVNAGALTINPALLSVVADAQSKDFGKPDPVLTYTATGFVNADTSVVFSGLLARAPGEVSGDYAITQGTLSAGNNYSIHFTGALLTVLKPKTGELEGVIGYGNALMLDFSTLLQTQRQAPDDIIDLDNGMACLAFGCPVQQSAQVSASANISGG